MNEVTGPPSNLNPSESQPNPEERRFYLTVEEFQEYERLWNSLGGLGVYSKSGEPAPGADRGWVTQNEFKTYVRLKSPWGMGNYDVPPKDMTFEEYYAQQLEAYNAAHPDDQAPSA